MRIGAVHPLFTLSKEQGAMIRPNVLKTSGSVSQPRPGNGTLGNREYCSRDRFTV